MSELLINKEYNLKEKSIKNIIDDYLISNFWKISKDYIENCKDCEYRYVCRDCRPVCMKEDNIFAKGNNCSYNPYKGIWE